MQSEVQPSTDIPSLCNIVPKSNGNLVLVSGYPYAVKLLDIDMDGIVLRQYVLTHNNYKAIGQAGNYGRMLLVDWWNTMELLDSEFNLMDFTGQLPGGVHLTFPSELYFNCERNEIIAIASGHHFQNRSLIIFQLTEI